MSDTNTAAPAASSVSNTTSNTAAPVQANQLAAAQDAVQNAPNAQAKAQAEQKVENLKRRYNLKVDGKDEVLDIDLANEQEVIKHLQMSRASGKRMQESAELKKGVQELVEMLRTNPAKVLNDPRLNISPEEKTKLANMIINGEIEEMNKTPEQKEKERLQREYDKLKADHETERKGREEAEKMRLQEQYARQFDEEITSAISTSGMPKTARTVRYLTEAMMFGLQNGLDLSAKDYIPYLKKHSLAEFKEIIGSLPDDEFESWLGKDQINRIRKRNLAKLKKPADAGAIKNTGAKASEPTSKAKEKIDLKKWLHGLGK